MLKYDKSSHFLRGNNLPIKFPQKSLSSVRFVHISMRPEDHAPLFRSCEDRKVYRRHGPTGKRHRPLSQRLDRCDRVIHNESGDPNGGNMCSFSGATCTSRVRHNADYVPYAKILFDL